MYGFAKRRGANLSYYMHPLFRRDQPHLIGQIQRKVEKKQPKKMRCSTVSIEEKLPAEQQVAKYNQLLLIEQIANLRIIEEDTSPLLRDSLSQAIRQYVLTQETVLKRVAGAGDGPHTADSFRSEQQ